MKKLFKPVVNGGREIFLGEINNGFYIRRVRNKHLYKYINPETKEEILGWTVDRDACEQDIFDSCSYITIKNTEEQKLYLIATKTFMTESIRLRDRYFLPLHLWEEKADHLAFKRVQVISREV